eukprot:TRINITY_DN8358_c0_g1_i11.p1 TRINITY_DN8358_c0_g1~~TRINITY_DN8358_c0_g1_i11.p1  ORF type:complete len:115 (+),score=15.23 TRINITY_DN8358_c0_g1_i11:554-898(+)
MVEMEKAPGERNREKVQKRDYVLFVAVWAGQAKIFLSPNEWQSLSRTSLLNVRPRPSPTEQQWKPEWYQKVQVEIIIMHVIFKQVIVTFIGKLKMGSTMLMWIWVYDSKDFLYK